MDLVGQKKRSHGAHPAIENPENSDKNLSEYSGS